MNTLERNDLEALIQKWGSVYTQNAGPYEEGYQDGLHTCATRLDDFLRVYAPTNPADFIPL